MFELDHAEFILVLPLFENIAHSRPLVFATLEQTHPGRVFVDNRTDAKAALLSFDDYLFFSGDYQHAKRSFDLRELIQSRIFKKSDYEYYEFYTFSDNAKNTCKEVLGDLVVGEQARKSFSLNKSRFLSMADWHSLIPDQMSLIWNEEKAANACGPDQQNRNPSPNRFAVCLMKDSEIISQCSAVFMGGGQAEISIETAEQYRRSGFATIVASAFIERCLAENIYPNWSCWSFREGSMGLAKKLGYDEKADNTVLILQKK